MAHTPTRSRIDGPLDALRVVASGALHRLNVGQARDVSIAIGIRPELVRRLIQSEFRATRAKLRQRRKRSTFQVAAGTSSLDASAMREHFFFEGSSVDLECRHLGLHGIPRSRRAVGRCGSGVDLAGVAAAWRACQARRRDGTTAPTTRRLRRTCATRQALAGADLHAIAAQPGHFTTLTHRAVHPLEQALTQREIVVTPAKRVPTRLRPELGLVPADR
jgi:hypothetical protein